MRTTDLTPTRAASTTFGRARLVFGGAVLVAGALFLPGCDNPACVFAGTCSGSSIGGALGTNPATVPANGETLRPAVPTVVGFFPGPTVAADPRTPIVLQFSESMSTANLLSAFELETPGFGAIPIQTVTLVGDGHLAVLLPIQELTAGTTYNLRFRENVNVNDRTGQPVVQAADRLLGTFSTAATTPAAPTVVATWPPANATDASTTTEIAVVFSRQIDSATMTDESFVVEIDGLEPEFDPTPQPVTLQGVLTDTRVWRWKSLDGENQPVSLGVGGELTLDLSPLGARIEDEDGAELAATTITARLLPFDAPLSVAITSIPNDAIGIEQVSGAADLAIEVETPGGVDGDVLGLFLFGREPTDLPEARTIALFREVPLEAPFTTFTITAAEINLLSSTDVASRRLAEGNVSFAFLLRRGALVSPVTLLDVDPQSSGVQSPIFDTTAPLLTGLGTSGTTTGRYSSDMRDLTLVGRANEELRGASVDSDLGSNEARPGVPPPVVGSHPSGLFIAAPVRVGVIPDTDQPVGYTLVVYDRALNASSAVSGTFTQVGRAAAGLPGPFFEVIVDVYDAATQRPIEGADVHGHEDFGGSLSFLGTWTTGPAGRVTVSPALLGETIVTVDARALGYELFTFDGVTTDRVSIPLQRASIAAATSTGQVASVDPDINLYSKSVADSRKTQPGELLSPVNACSFDTTDARFECSFPAINVQARTIGGISAFAVQVPPSILLFNAQAFLKAFELLLPVPPIEPGVAQNHVLNFGTLLDDPSLDGEERALELPGHGLTTAQWPALDGAPRVRVEGTVPGLARNVVVGQGVAFGDGLPAGTFAVRSAIPGSVDGTQDAPEDALGRLIVDGTIEPDLLLRAEVVAADGSRGGARPRLSLSTLALDPPAAPVLGAVPLALNAGGIGLDLSFTDVLSDAAAQPGLYRIRVNDGAGQVWTIWRIDAPDASGPESIAHLPFVDVGNTLPLAPGVLNVQISAWSWGLFDPSSFMWTDVEREFDRFAHSRVLDATTP